MTRMLTRVRVGGDLKREGRRQFSAGEQVQVICEHLVKLFEQLRLFPATVYCSCKQASQSHAPVPPIIEDYQQDGLIRTFLISLMMPVMYKAMNLVSPTEKFGKPSDFAVGMYGTEQMPIVPYLLCLLGISSVWYNDS